jgi:PhnB protein
MQGETATEEAKVRAVIEDWAKAIRAKDADRALSHAAPDVVEYSLAPPLVAEAADRKGLEAWFSTWQGPIGYELRDLRVAASSDLAFCHSVNRMSGSRTSGEKTDLWFRHTVCFRKIDGAWKIVHFHESVPFYMDGSYKAAIDLKP